MNSFHLSLHAIFTRILSVFQQPVSPPNSVSPHLQSAALPNFLINTKAHSRNKYVAKCPNRKHFQKKIFSLFTDSQWGPKNIFFIYLFIFFTFFYLFSYRLEQHKGEL